MANRYRVAHVVRKYNPEQWGGTETYLAEMTKRLTLGEWSCDVYAPQGPMAQDHALDPGVRLERYHAFLPFLAREEQRKALIANAGNIASFDLPIRLARDRSIDIVHLHTTGRIGGAVRMAMKWTGRPYVVAAHGPLLVDRDAVLRDVRARHDRAIDMGAPIGAVMGARRVIDDAARVIAFNEEERRALEKRIGRRAVRMDHGVDVERFARGDSERAKGIFAQLGDGPVILSVGRLSHQKNQLHSLRIFARGAPSTYRLVFAGAETDPGYRATLEREARQLGVRDRVVFLGNVDATKLPDLYARSELAIAPSTHETFGLVVLEAWASKRPMLFSAHSGMKDLSDALGADNVASIAGLDVETWAERLREFLASAQMRQHAAEAGFALVCRRFHWDAVASKLAALYETVIEETEMQRISTPFGKFRIQ